VEKFGNGRIEVGCDAYIGDDCLISCACAVTIGDHTLLAHGVHIFDNDTHPLNWKQRSADVENLLRGKTTGESQISHSPVQIGEHVWVGFNSCIMKGVVIGPRSVIAAGSVVTKDVPSDTLVGGNPAKVIRSLIEVTFSAVS
jgi:acetyltransferase-like isoleucine patch superfamily enzyme